MTRAKRLASGRETTSRLGWMTGAVVIGLWSCATGHAETKPAARAAAQSSTSPAQSSVPLASSQPSTPPEALPTPVQAFASPTAIAQLPPLDAWTPAEIAAGIAQCSQLLAGKDVVATPIPAFKDGDCGAPAAVQLVSIGRNPEVMINPPVTVTCEIASTLATWVKTDLQPMAKAHLGAAIVRIDTMSSYSCRNAYGRKKSRLSEHGRANAIDIRAFQTKADDEVAVLVDWGINERRQAAIVAAAKAADAKRVAAAALEAKVLAARRALAPTTTTASIPTVTTEQPAIATSAGTRAEPARNAQPAMALDGADTASGDRDGSLPLPRLGTLIEGLPNLAARIPNLSRPALNGSGFGEPSRLGGAKPQTVVAPAHVASRKEIFLRAVHAYACRTFGTVLGPEANAAHENHFHFDMAERGGKHFCE